MFLKKYVFTCFAVCGLFFLGNAQQNKDYAGDWKTVARYEKKGLTKSALNQVIKIYHLAVQDKNEAQQVKACIYQLKYRDQLDDNSQVSNLLFLDTVIQKAAAPARNVLLSIKAATLWQYLQREGWQLYNRTTVNEEKSDDITTWDIRTLTTAIGAAYEASLNNPELLQTTDIRSYEAILEKGNTTYLRPTLYDLLAQRALSYFTTGSSYLVSNPASDFKIDDTSYLAPATVFAHASFTTTDTASLLYKAVRLLQQLLAFHEKEASPEALIDADLVRLQLVNNYGTIKDQEKRYELALKNIETTYPASNGTAQAMYLRAVIYQKHGDEYQALNNPVNQYELKRARTLCNVIVQQYPGTEGASNARNLLAQIEEPTLQIQTEQVNVPEQPFRNLVTYKNIPVLYIRIIRMTDEKAAQLEGLSEEHYWETLGKMPAVKAWSISLPDLHDYQQHAAEIKADALSSGFYLIIASKKADFSLTDNILAAQETYVSNISYINNDSDYYVLNRDSGLPLEGIQVQVWEEKYDYKTGQSTQTKREHYSTDEHGYFQLIHPEKNRSIRLQFIGKDDTLFMHAATYNAPRYIYSSYTTMPLSFLFTDRSIYRPGQLIYFKGIVANNYTTVKKSDVIAGYKTTIWLRDANYQQVGALAVTTNDYGSYHGTFSLPTGTLNGNFTLTDSATGSSTTIHVEEYKRPTFRAQMEKPTNAYRLNDSITITGYAHAYSGSMIDGATVKYRITRKPRIILPVGYARTRTEQLIKAPAGSPPTEIMNGVTFTDATGRFYIRFKAVPDDKVSPKEQSVFIYEVTADVTDQNGETRSAATSINVAYQLLQLNVNIPEKIPADQFTQLQIVTTNLNDIKENTIASLRIEKLQSPGRIFRERYWEQPDQFTMSREEYYNYFPYDIYKNENESSSYPVENLVWEQRDSSNKMWAIERLQPGYYKVTAAVRDSSDKEVTLIKYVQLLDTAVSPDEPLTLSFDKAVAEPGQNAILTICSGFKKIWLIYSLKHPNDQHTISYETISDSTCYQQPIPVMEQDRGGLAVECTFVRHNRVYERTQQLDVPWSNKDLTLTLHTFRDQLQPGAKETWSLEVSGYKGEKVAAEMLASMYDQSLDQFSYQEWKKPYIWPGVVAEDHLAGNNFMAVSANVQDYYSWPATAYIKQYDVFINEPAPIASEIKRKTATLAGVALAAPAADYNTFRGNRFTEASKHMKLPSAMNMDTGKNGILDSIDDQSTSLSERDSVQIRQNFNETAFFYPDLRTDSTGNISFSFTMPDALTQWKLMLLAHTRELASGYVTHSVITQKPLMVQMNAPRFLREGDTIIFTTKISNITDSLQKGNVRLSLSDAVSGNAANQLFHNQTPDQHFIVPARQSIVVKFPLIVPVHFNSALQYRIVAQSHRFSDGETMVIPVISNRALVTESLPLDIKGNNSKTVVFDKLVNNKSATLYNHLLTVEYTPNPSWYAIQALPYLMEYPYECVEQTFNRYYANILAASIINMHPRIKTLFDQWKNTDTTIFLSTLQKNEALKQVLLQETPWILDAQNETQQKKNLALLFDMDKMHSETGKTLEKLKSLQTSNGGFAWFKGGNDDRYITQYILTGIGRLFHLNVLSADEQEQLEPILKQALYYLDKQLADDYAALKKYEPDLKSNHLGSLEIQYLYMRSFFPAYKIPAYAQPAYNYYRQQVKSCWTGQNKYLQGLIALFLYNADDTATAKAILASLKETAIHHSELGAYWKEWVSGGYYWYEAPIESQALMIEAFSTIGRDTAMVEDLKTWLLKQKQTNNWKTTKATADACYALLLTGNNWLNDSKKVTISLGDTVIQGSPQQEAGSGYIKAIIPARDIRTNMGHITLSVSDSSATWSSGWGAAYWQYWEDLDKITSAATPLSIDKKLFVTHNTDHGPVLYPIESNTRLAVGDKITVRILLKADRNMEYIQLKDMRASCLEPANVLSGYQWQNGLGYYESTKDATTSFFFNSLPKGQYIFEYQLIATHSGEFGNGIASVQCMYAPAFSSHSEGIRIRVNP